MHNVNLQKREVRIGSRTISIETGKLAKQAHGSVIVRSGDTMVLVAAGVRSDRIVLDPGFGFAKLSAHNWSLLRGLERVLELEHPVLVGTSRKTFLGRLGVAQRSDPRPPLDRDVATAATSMHAARLGAWGVRVHHVPSTLDAMRVARAIQDAP